jgi:hypothetical protein
MSQKSLCTYTTTNRHILSINIRKLAQQTGVSSGSTRSALKKHLHLHPYKIASAHELAESGKAKRDEYSRKFRDVITANRQDILNVTFFSMRRGFTSDYVNIRNSRLWPATNPYEIKDTPLHDRAVGVWCTVSRNRIVGPIFFDDTMKSERYCEVILNPFI